MTKERWTKIQTLFELALEKDPPERETFLKKECSGDPELLEELISLLKADEDVHEILGGVALDSFQFEANAIYS